MKPTYRDVCYTLCESITYSTDMLRAADSVMRMIDATYPTKIESPDGKATFDPETNKWEFSHDSLVASALSNASVMQEVAYGKKIGAIKSLRFFTGCGLKQAKDAIEDKRVWQMDPELADHMRDYKSGTFAEDN